MIVLLTDTITPRLQYVAEFIFKENWGVDYFITTSKKDFGESNAIKINYTEDQFSGNVINISGSRLLFEKKIHLQNIETFETNGLTAFFKNETAFENFSFDIFAATFYLLSRYEEYLPHNKDEYGRYDHRQSVASATGFLKIPIINNWLESFADFIKNKYAGFQIINKAFNFLPTYDVDIAYEWRHKGFLRNTGQLLKLLTKQDYKKITEAFKILEGKTKDPSDNFEFFANLHKQLNLQPVYFFLVSKNNTKYDKNISPYNSKMKALIQELAQENDIGVHPSYYSSTQEKALKEEKFLLEEIAGKIIQKSRLHYLRFNLPETYRKLIDAGITDEFSMGYGAVNGFRASYADTFHWYDIEKEEKTNLIVHPFCYMDSVAIFDQKLSSEESFEELMYFYNTCKNVNGTFISVMHNHLMGDNDLEWRNVYEQFLSKANEHVNA
ncbi:MAG: polysaccharide deacetylase family protein [Bacteroidota bacterium]|nr:polysaccharide deacetylase family protein [Bacteroidota bacterium]